ncbi:Kinesin-like protein [Seminavis robusta]|uniref:Kinesin-like protein n=1 Tax=Seminavis robusta TaxID=568900 RepID=A0A9N8DPS3_9STRA|nr:Kinesin-like protein [Seminavis robusta]|eukprot:Sro251_g099320.1 Kinesin-like protein (1331) ;mRNA; r:49148-53234
MVTPIKLDASSSRGAGAFFSSPPMIAKSVYSFRSPKPVKTSNIRVITRIRPLLDGEVALGKAPQIVPIDSLDNQPQQIQSTQFDPHNSNFRSPLFPQNGSLIPPPLSSSSAKTSFSLLPPKSSSRLSPLKTRKQTSIVSTSLLATVGPNSQKQFNFDAVLGMQATQQQVYATAVGDKISTNIFNGINVTIMAYGQTASGKSHTMQGLHDQNNGITGTTSFDSDSENISPDDNGLNFNVAENEGIIPRALHDLFKGKNDYQSSGKGNVTIDLVFYELYNDGIRDLMTSDDDYKSLALLDQGEVGVFIEGLTTTPIHSVRQAHALMTYAAQRRVTASTMKNVQSSRSHSICTLTVRCTPLAGTAGEITQACLTLVDLAGSERIKKTGVVGVQQQESITINKDLFVLGKVVSALADKHRSASKKGKQTHVPFRDSKLTRLLRDSLGGNCFTVFISCVSPADIDMEESINTLRYAERARSISNSIKRNVARTSLSPKQCAAITAENMRLKAMVIKLKNRVAADISRETAPALLDLDQEPHLCSPPPPTSPPYPTKEIFRPTAQQSAISHKSKKGLSPIEIARSGSFLDMDEQHEPQICSPFAPNAQIFRPPSRSSTSSTSSFSKSEDQSQQSEITKNSDKPVWMHFKDLAKITRNVTFPLQSNVEVPGVSNEIELSERSIATQASKESSHGGISSGRVLQLGPQDSVSIEMSELSGRGSNSPIVEERKGNIARLKAETNSLQSAIADLKSEQARMEEKLHIASEEARTMKASYHELQQELYSLEGVVNSKKKELEELNEKSKMEQQCDAARRDSLKEEVAHLDRFVAQLANDVNQLDLCSPQRSFCRILDTAEASIGLDDASCNVENQLQSSLSCLQDKFNLLENQMQSSDELEQQLVHANKQRRLHDRDKAILGAQIAGLEDKLTNATQDADQARQEKEECVVCYEAKIANLAKTIQSLESTHSFLQTDYASVTASLHEKISDLQDTVIQERAQRTEFGRQMQSLKKSNADLTIHLSNKAELLATEQAMTAELRDCLDKVESENRRLKEERVTAIAQPSDPERESATLAILTKIAENDDVENASPHSNLSQCDYIRIKAQRMLQLADAAIVANDVKSTSTCSSAASQFRPRASAESGKDAGTSQPMDKVLQPVSSANSVEITNLNAVFDNTRQCTCASAMFAQNAEHVEFYLPKIVVGCTCGKQPKKVEDDRLNPCALDSILRPWQVAFLASQGITDAVGLVHAGSHRGSALAKEMRKWRSQQGLPSIRTGSCSVALHIWERTCRQILSSVRKQKAQGVLVPKRPEFLELNTSEHENNTAVSSLGGGPFRTSS